jgi:hypothetical protein
LELSALSTEYVKTSVIAIVNGTVIDPTSDTVQMAFPLRGVSPVAGDWKAGSWETVSGLRYARCLVGPAGGTVTLAAGFYDCWLKVTDSPEVPARRVGQITVY